MRTTLRFMSSNTTSIPVFDFRDLYTLPDTPFWATPPIDETMHSCGVYDERDRMNPGKRIKIAAWIIIISHLVGVLANGYSWLVGDPSYSSGLWLCFMVLKFIGLVSGVLMIRGRVLGVYLFVASLIGGAVVALTFTGPYPMWQWAGAAIAMATIVSSFLVVVRLDWAQHCELMPKR